jgi:hypothetical protein
MFDGRDQEEIRDRVDLGEWDWRELEEWRYQELISGHDFEDFGA